MPYRDNFAERLEKYKRIRDIEKQEKKCKYRKKYNAEYFSEGFMHKKTEVKLIERLEVVANKGDPWKRLPFGMLFDMMVAEVIKKCRGK